LIRVASIVDHRVEETFVTVKEKMLPEDEDDKKKDRDDEDEDEDEKKKADRPEKTVKVEIIESGEDFEVDAIEAETEAEPTEN
jgi:hypothetical protein